ncbi:DGQHR domain-containing protein [Undibacterium flavidum]|uniref:DGQHR domain-containing protein n=1 Tax=Undibacterium flavidum TaxID=2762297 RepID=A0ABR6Y632_9BURK|nr:DGQHR domain-containing protein [Undibacterium flavidum]MBC3872018.1 DGQHR domain-containing protein [Undibacterium flavidum]
MAEKQYEEVNATFSLITQNKYKFYSLTLPSDVLAKTCFVTTRDEDPETGFQRVLDKKRAQEIADYVDSGFGTVPNAIILSAQQEAQLEIKAGRRALRFQKHPKAFLVLDGQHRIWGYNLATSHLRVPVIIYEKLSRKEETRLFIDINTKQKPVPNELLLDIKHLADLEKDSESLLRELFDTFHQSSDSVLTGLLSPHEKARGKLTRTTFNASFLTVNDILLGKDIDELYEIFNAYLSAVYRGLKKLGAQELLVNPTAFKAFISFFPEVASRVKDRFEGDYKMENFIEVLQPVFAKITKVQISTRLKSYKAIVELMTTPLSKAFSL